MPSPELKPCPFCGCEELYRYTRHASFWEADTDRGSPWYATEFMCHDCGAMVRFFQFFKPGIRHETALAKTRRLAIAAWNRRDEGETK